MESDSFYYRVNVSALKQVDPTAINILDSASHVALYKFNSIDNKWEKTDIEGAMFLYDRTATPNHAFVIKSRLNTENLLEPVVPGLDFQRKEPFLLYKIPKSAIYGIWFYDSDECYRMTTNLQKLVQKSTPKEQPAVTKHKEVDIFGMLSKAQQEYNLRNKPEKAEPAAPIPVPQQNNKPAAVVSSQSVMDFFAKATTNSQLTTSSSADAMKSLQPGSGGLPMTLPSPPNNTNMKPILMRIMSNPAHSVEHIEKQQRSVTPEAKKQAPQTIENGIPFSTVPGQHLFGPPLPVPADVQPPQPALIPPGMLFSSATNADIDAPVNHQSISGWDQPPIPEVAPLTRNQLLQAITYLIKNDPDFVKQIHEAYVKSFNNIL